MATKKAVTTADVKAHADVEEGYTVVESPLGVQTTVPDSIVDRLVESGYTAR